MRPIGERMVAVWRQACKRQGVTQGEMARLLGEVRSGGNIRALVRRTEAAGLVSVERFSDGSMLIRGVVVKDLSQDAVRALVRWHLRHGEAIPGDLARRVGDLEPDHYAA